MMDEFMRAAMAAAVRAELSPVLAELQSLRAAVEAREPRPWLTRAQAAETLGCSVDTIDRRVAAGELPTQRIGRRGLRVRLPATPEPAEIARMASEARGK